MASKKLFFLGHLAKVCVCVCVGKNVASKLCWIDQWKKQGWTDHEVGTFRILRLNQNLSGGIMDTTETWEWNFISAQKHDINKEGHELPISGSDYLVMAMFPAAKWRPGCSKPTGFACPCSRAILLLSSWPRRLMSHGISAILMGFSLINIGGIQRYIMVYNGLWWFP